MFTLTVFEILLFDCRLVLGPTERVAVSERVDQLQLNIIFCTKQALNGIKFC